MQNTTNIYGISFFNRVKLQFHGADYGKLGEMIEGKGYDDFFVELGNEDFGNWLKVTEEELQSRVFNYEAPVPLEHQEFETRWVRNLLGKNFILDPKNSAHFQILLLSDLCRNLILSQEAKENFFLIQKNKFIDENQERLILRSLYMLRKQGPIGKEKLRKQLIDIIGAQQVDFLFDITMEKLTKLSIVEQDGVLVTLGKKSSFFLNKWPPPARVSFQVCT